MFSTRVVAAVIRRGELLLVCKRPLHKRHGGLWEFPGGKCELEESDADAARRELAEELEVTVVAVGAEIYASQDPGSEFHIAFLPVEIADEPQCIEHAVHKWASMPELLTMPLAPSDRRFVEFLYAQSQ